MKLVSFLILFDWQWFTTVNFNFVYLWILKVSLPYDMICSNLDISTLHVHGHGKLNITVIKYWHIRLECRKQACLADPFVLCSLVKSFPRHLYTYLRIWLIFLLSIVVIFTMQGYLLYTYTSLCINFQCPSYLFMLYSDQFNFFFILTGP